MRNGMSRSGLRIEPWIRSLGCRSRLGDCRHCTLPFVALLCRMHVRSRKTGYWEEFPRSGFMVLLMRTEQEVMMPAR